MSQNPKTPKPHELDRDDFINKIKNRFELELSVKISLLKYSKLVFESTLTEKLIIFSELFLFKNEAKVCHELVVIALVAIDADHFLVWLHSSVQTSLTF